MLPIRSDCSKHLVPILAHDGRHDSIGEKTLGR